MFENKVILRIIMILFCSISTIMSLQLWNSILGESDSIIEKYSIQVMILLLEYSKCYIGYISIVGIFRGINLTKKIRIPIILIAITLFFFSILASFGLIFNKQKNSELSIDKNNPEYIKQMKIIKGFEDSKESKNKQIQEIQKMIKNSNSVIQGYSKKDMKMDIEKAKNDCDDDIEAAARRQAYLNSKNQITLGRQEYRRLYNQAKQNYNYKLDKARQNLENANNKMIKQNDKLDSQTNKKMKQIELINDQINKLDLKIEKVSEQEIKTKVKGFEAVSQKIADILPIVENKDSVETFLSLLFGLIFELLVILFSFLSILASTDTHNYNDKDRKIDEIQNKINKSANKIISNIQGKVNGILSKKESGITMVYKPEKYQHQQTEESIQNKPQPQQQQKINETLIEKVFEFMKENLHPEGNCLGCKEISKQLEIDETLVRSVHRILKDKGLIKTEGLKTYINEVTK